MEEKPEQPAPEADLIAIAHNQIPLWLTVRALARLGIINHDTFMAAVRAEIDKELGYYPLDPEFEKQLERCYQLIDFNANPDAPPSPNPKRKPRR